MTDITSSARAHMRFAHTLVLDDYSSTETCQGIHHAYTGTST